MSEHDQAYEAADISDVVGGGVESVVRLAAHAFDGLEKHDQEIDDLCEAILFRKIERPPFRRISNESRRRPV